MGIKKKMGMGILTGALGLSLIGGGTYAAFNDVETIENTFAAGTLDLTVDPSVVFDLSNLKPGDHFSETLTLGNGGTLDINQVFAKFSTSDWNEVGGDNNKNEFLNQFLVDITSSKGHTINNVPLSTLSSALSSGAHDITNSNATQTGIEPGEEITYTITIEFKDDPSKEGDGITYVQNKYQGEGVNLEVMFEATQMPGEERSND